MLRLVYHAGVLPYSAGEHKRALHLSRLENSIAESYCWQKVLDSSQQNVIEYIIERSENCSAAPVAQLVERYLGKVEVSSSSLVGSFIKCDSLGHVSGRKYNAEVMLPFFAPM